VITALSHDKAQAGSVTGVTGFPCDRIEAR